MADVEVAENIGSEAAAPETSKVPPAIEHKPDNAMVPVTASKPENEVVPTKSDEADVNIPETTNIAEIVARELVPCSTCGRKFRPDALQRHEKICQKVKTKKRKVFDSSQKRAQGSDIAAAPKVPQPAAKEKPEKPKKKSNWRAKHEEFIRTVRAAKGVVTEEDDTHVPSRVPVGYVACPTCGRNFSERAAERHIKWCGEQKSRIPKSPGSNEAAERLKARTKYRAPPPGKKGALPTHTRSIVKKRSDDNNNSSSPNADGRSTGASSSPNSIEGVSGSKLIPKVNARSRALVKRNSRKAITNASRNRDTTKAKVSNVYNANKQDKNPSKGVMKFKEKFPNRKYMFDGEDGYETFHQIDEQFNELMKSNTRISNTPRTVPGVRTAGNSNKQAADVNMNYSNANLNQKYIGTSLDDDMAVLQARLGNLGPFRLRNGMNNDFSNRWTSNANESFESSGLPAVSSSESPPLATANKDRWVIDGETRSSTSGSSDGSLPPLSRGSSSEGRLPRFCHQCGTKYPISGAKYCCECGARRLGTIAPFTSATTAAA